MLSTCAILIAVLAMAGKQAGAQERKELFVSDELKSLCESNNRFALDMYAQLAKSQSGNMFFSPTSIATALAMTYAGAEGVTQKEMAEALRLNLPEDQVHKAFASLMSRLNPSQPEAFELNMANRLWGQEGEKFLEEFLAITREAYGAELAELDFVRNAELARTQINAWVEQQTKERIKDLIPEGVLSSLTRLVLTNAIYFKGMWELEFDEKATKDAPFTVTAGTKVTVPMMAQKSKFKYAGTETVQLLEMPYKGDALSMLVLLPREVDGLSALEKELSAERLDAWISSMRSVEVQVYFPRMELTGEFQLNSMLAALGMPTAFSATQADFSGMNGKRDLFISAAIHKAYVKVNEEGTEAAAATGIVMRTLSMPRPPEVFRADHPFVFAIRENQTGGILFLGRLVNPGQ
jgi:serpin B